MWHTQNKNFTPKLKENNPEKKKELLQEPEKNFLLHLLSVLIRQKRV